MPSPWDAFKVTALSIRHSEYKGERLVLYNVNLPVHLIPNKNVYAVIRDTIVHDFTTIQAHIFSYRPSTRWWIAIPAMCELGREALIRVIDKPVNWQRTDILKLTPYQFCPSQFICGGGCAKIKCQLCGSWTNFSLVIARLEKHHF